jgi:hypothetical protein
MEKYSKEVRIAIIYTFILFSFSCLEKSDKGRFKNELVYNINVDSIRYIDVFPREDSILVARFKLSNDLDYIQLLCKRNNKKDVLFYYKSEWVTADSMYNNLETINEIKIINRIEYTIDIFLDLELKNINYDYESSGVRVVAPNGCTYYNITDKDIINEFEADSLIEKLEKNWWIEK